VTLAPKLRPGTEMGTRTRPDRSFVGAPGWPLSGGAPAADPTSMHSACEPLPRPWHYLPQALVTTLAVTAFPGLLVGGLQGVGLVSSWALAIAIGTALSVLIAAAGSAWWVRRPHARDIVFADLMLWGWVRRQRTERRLASASWLLGDAAGANPARRARQLEQLSATLEARDAYTHGHSKRVTRHAYMIARGMGLAPEHAARVRTAAALHDVGKLETPRAVLNKPGRLSDEEFALIKRHPVDGARMVADLGDDEVVAIVRHHHERLDGGGYPDGLRGDQIPLGARIIAVADTFDALTSTRPYRPGCRHKKALDILRKEAGTQLDPGAVAAFLRYYSGRRAIPGWTTVAVAPPRVAAWISSAVQGVSAVPLGSGAAALGATFALTGALAVQPMASETAARLHDAPPAQPGDAGGLGYDARASVETKRPVLAGAHHHAGRGGDRRPHGRDGSGQGGRFGAPGAGGRRGAGPGGGSNGSAGSDAKGRASGGNDAGGASRMLGGGRGGAGKLADALPEVREVSDLPLPDATDVTDLPEADLSEADLPVLPSVERKLPAVGLPPVPLAPVKRKLRALGG
jgi:putative nucleotidyltransferase with HDIG domain